MKKPVLVVLFLALAALFNGAMAQYNKRPAPFQQRYGARTHSQYDGPKNVIRFNPGSLLLGTGNLTYERVIFDQASVQLGVSYTRANVRGFSASGVGFVPEFRYYFSEKGATNGFYVAPFARFLSLNASYKDAANDIDEHSRIRLTGGGLLGGGQFSIGKLVKVDMYLGPQLLSASGTHLSNSGKENLGRNIGSLRFLQGGAWIRAGVTVGVAF
jgi:hypothetical protein